MSQEGPSFVAMPVFTPVRIPRAIPTEHILERRFEQAKERGDVEVPLREYEWNTLKEELERLRGQICIARGVH